MFFPGGGQLDADAIGESVSDGLGFQPFQSLSQQAGVFIGQVEAGGFQPEFEAAVFVIDLLQQ